MEKNEEEEIGLISLVRFLVMLVGLTLSMLEILTRICASDVELLTFVFIGRGDG